VCDFTENKVRICAQHLHERKLFYYPSLVTCEMCAGCFVIDQARFSKLCPVPPSQLNLYGHQCQAFENNFHYIHHCDGVVVLIYLLIS